MGEPIGSVAWKTGLLASTCDQSWVAQLRGSVTVVKLKGQVPQPLAVVVGSLFGRQLTTGVVDGSHDDWARAADANKSRHVRPIEVKRDVVARTVRVMVMRGSWAGCPPLGNPLEEQGTCLWLEIV
jgi:hypothetical protein